MRELRFILFTVATLALTGIGIVSCTSTGPRWHTPDAKAERDPYNPPTKILPAAPAPAKVQSRASVMVIQPRRKAVAPLAWDAVSGADRYLVRVSHGNQDWYKTLDVGTNTTINLTNVSPPLEIEVSAVNASGEGPPSSEVYYGVANSNGSLMAGQFVFIANTNSVYALYNSPLLKTNWTLIASISNRQGLVTVPLPGQTGDWMWTVGR